MQYTHMVYVIEDRKGNRTSIVRKAGPGNKSIPKGCKIVACCGGFVKKKGMD